MGLTKPEWFKMNPAKFLSDVRVSAMSTLELGCCFLLLCRQHLDGYIPDDLPTLARLCKLDASGMAQAWEGLRDFFPIVEPGKRANRYMWEEREQVMADLRRRSDEGTRAAQKRWAEKKSLNAGPNGSPMPHPMQDQTRPDQSRADKTNGAATLALEAGSSLKENSRPAKAQLELPTWLPLVQWTGFVEMRRRIKAPLTDRAIQLAIGALEKLRAQGHDPAAVLDQSTAGCWKGLYPLKANGNGNASANKPASRPRWDFETKGAHA